MTAATTTGLAIRQGLVEYGDWVFLGQTTSTVADTSSVPDVARLQGANLSSTMFNNCIVRIASGARAGERSYVDYLDADNGVLYLTPALTGALTSGDQYEIWLKGIDPDIVDRLRDDCLSKFCSQWRIVPLSVVADGDMEAADVTHWTIVGAATRTKAYGSFPDVHSRQELKVVHTVAANDYVESDPINVNPGEAFFLQAPIRAYVTATPQTPATASIVVWDKTNAASVALTGLKTTQVGAGQGWISQLWTVPAGCYQITLRLSTATANSTTVWGGIACHKKGKQRISLPDRITTKKRIGTFYTASQVNTAVGSQADIVFKVADFRVIDLTEIGSQVEVYFNPATAEYAIYYYERSYFARLSTGYFTVAQRTAGDAAITDAKIEYLIAATAMRVAKHYMDKYGADWMDDYTRAEAEFNYWDEQMGPRREDSAEKTEQNITQSAAPPVVPPAPGPSPAPTPAKTGKG